ncbi:MAG TPA: ATP-binding protein, partial [Tepidisphaeraceae bacterium]|nr:ATP-binding protein [Tepidisphaeraceae bacterium]
TIAKRPRRGLLLRGESSVASIGIAASAVLLVSMAALAWWTTRIQSEYAQSTRQEQVRSAGVLLAQSIEVMLQQNELSAARRLIADAARNQELSQCRVVLPDGQVVADAEPMRITAHKLPATWAPAVVQESFTHAGREIHSVYPLTISGRGSATLELSALIQNPTGVYLQTQTGVGIVGAMGLCSMLIGYRHIRKRFRAIGAIAEALLASAAGETDQAVLSVSDDLGPEAAAWNAVLAEQNKLREQTVAEKAQQALTSRRSGRGDLDAAFDALSQGLILVDQQMKIRQLNGAATAFLQAQRETAINADITTLLNQNEVLESIRSVTSGTMRRRTTVEVERQSDSGNVVLRFGVRPVRREDSAAAMILIEDITQQKVAEESRNHFVAHATHELRTPLTNMRLYIETAIEDGDKDPLVRGKCLNVINQEARRLERIVGEMLSVSEMEAGSFKIRRDDIRLDQLFRDLATDYEAQAKEKNQKLNFNLPPKMPVIQGDRDKVALCVHNLLGNALKYTPEGGEVTVSLEYDVKQLSINVTDTGIGISEEDAAKIFERFYRASDPRVEKITGTGLGLTLAREIARLHGGDINVKSQLNKGSTFTISLPGVAEAA